jgi:Xaa-Pro dipeptidase
MNLSYTEEVAVPLMLADPRQLEKTGQAVVLEDGRKRSFLNAEGADKPLKSPVPRATMLLARAYRLSRIRGLLAEHDCAAILLYDPVNIRYALDCANIQVWTLHNPLRYALIFAEGPSITFEFKGGEHLCDGLETIDELRTATGWMYMTSGNRVPEKIARWADEIADLVWRAWRRQPACGDRPARSRRLARP